MIEIGAGDGAPSKIMQGKGKQLIPAGESLVFETPGGGGYGDLLKRRPAQVARDCAAGLISKKAARKDYGVSLKHDGSVDTLATRELRRK
jgi:N-methylhydantoinase B